MIKSNCKLVTACFIALIGICCILTPGCFGGKSGMRKESRQAKSSPEETHETYRSAIEKHPENADAYAAYAAWAPKSVESRVGGLQQEIEATRDAKLLDEINTGLGLLMEEINEVEGYLLKKRRLGLEKFRKAFNKFKIQAEEDRTLIEYALSQTAEKIKVSKKHSRNKLKKGRREYLKFHLEEAYRCLSEALAFDGDNAPAATLVREIKLYFDGDDLIAQKKLAEAEDHFKKMANDNVLPAVSRRKITEIRNLRSQAKRFLNSGDNMAARKSFAKSQLLYKKAASVNANFESEVVSRFNAVKSFDTAFRHYKARDYDKALKDFEKGLEFWPDFKSAKKWISMTQSRMKQAEAESILAEGLAKLETGDIKAANGLFKEAVRTASKPRKIRKTVGKAKKKAKKALMKEAGAAKKEKHLSREWLAYRRCVALGPDRRCSKKLKKLDGKLLASLQATGEDAGERGDWATAYASWKLAAGLAPENDVIHEELSDMEEEALSENTLVFHLKPPKETIDGLEVCEGLSRIFSKSLDEEKLNWRFAEADDVEEDSGRHMLMIFNVTLPPPPEAKNGKENQTPAVPLPRMEADPRDYEKEFEYEGEFTGADMSAFVKNRIIPCFAPRPATKNLAAAIKQDFAFKPPRERKNMEELLPLIELK